MREVRSRVGEDGSLSLRALLELLRGQIRKGISERVEDSEVEVMKHEAVIYYSSHRVLATNYKTGQNTKTVGWRTPCSCGLIIETKQNSIKAHKAKVQKHIEEAK